MIQCVTIRAVIWNRIGNSLCHYFLCFPHNETPRCIRNPTQSKYRTISTNRTFQYIAVYLPALAVHKPPFTAQAKSRLIKQATAGQADSFGQIYSFLRLAPEQRKSCIECGIRNALTVEVGKVTWGLRSSDRIVSKWQSS